MTNTIHYRDGYKYQLANPYSCMIPLRPPATIMVPFITFYMTGNLQIASGYAWDGPSGPTVDTRSAMRGSLIHDALYQLMRMRQLAGFWRDMADQIYRDTAIYDGVMLAQSSWWGVRHTRVASVHTRYNLHYIFLRAGGAAAASPANTKEILTAP